MPSPIFGERVVADAIALAIREAWQVPSDQRPRVLSMTLRRILHPADPTEAIQAALLVLRAQPRAPHSDVEPNEHCSITLCVRCREAKILPHERAVIYKKSAGMHLLRDPKWFRRQTEVLHQSDVEIARNLKVCLHTVRNWRNRWRLHPDRCGPGALGGRDHETRGQAKGAAVIEYRNGERVTWWRNLIWRAFPTMETYEISQPWVIWIYFVPDWVTRIVGRTQIRAECSICGLRETLTIRMPRWGPVVDRGPHPKRTAFLAEHVHPLQASAPETWARPLRNPAAHSDTLDILRDAVERAALQQGVQQSGGEADRANG